MILNDRTVRKLLSTKFHLINFSIITHLRVIVFNGLEILFSATLAATPYLDLSCLVFYNLSRYSSNLLFSGHFSPKQADRAAACGYLKGQHVKERLDATI